MLSIQVTFLGCKIHSNAAQLLEISPFWFVENFWIPNLPANPITLWHWPRTSQEPLKGLLHAAGVRDAQYEGDFRRGPPSETQAPTISGAFSVLSIQPYPNTPILASPAEIDHSFSDSAKLISAAGTKHQVTWKLASSEGMHTFRFHYSLRPNLWSHPATHS